MYGNYPNEHRSLGLPPLFEDDLDEWLSAVVEDGENFVALVDGVVVGHAVYLEAGSGPADFVVFVDPAYHDRGIGTALLRFAIDRARSEGVERIVSHVEADNENALHVYEKVGFEVLEAGPMVVAVGIELGDRSRDARD